MQEAIARLSFELNKSPEDIKNLYKNYWAYIKQHIEDLPLKEDLSEEEFENLKVNFNIASLGKFACPYSNYIKIKRQDNYRRKINNDKHKEDKTDS